MVVFNGHPDINVIWKAMKGSQLVDPIAGYKSDNIRYSIAPLNKELKKADLAFFDFASTPVYDAVKMGVPVLCFNLFHQFYVREDMMNKVYNYGNDRNIFRFLQSFIKFGMKREGFKLISNKDCWIDSLLES